MRVSGRPDNWRELVSKSKWVDPTAPRFKEKLQARLDAMQGMIDLLEAAQAKDERMLHVAWEIFGNVVLDEKGLKGVLAGYIQAFHAVSDLVDYV